MEFMKKKCQVEDLNEPIKRFPMPHGTPPQRQILGCGTFNLKVTAEHYETYAMNDDVMNVF